MVCFILCDFYHNKNALKNEWMNWDQGEKSKKEQSLTEEKLFFLEGFYCCYANIDSGIHSNIKIGITGKDKFGI